MSGTAALLRLSLLLCLLPIAACNYTSQKAGDAAGTPPIKFSKAELVYSEVDVRVFKVSCTGCHGTSGNVSLESYEAVKRNLQDVERSVFVERRMPKGTDPSLSAEQLGLLRAWIDAGAPAEEAQ